ncbi:MAG: ABC transporter ATP-binding protein, partial [Pseudomonadota bacterium]
ADRIAIMKDGAVEQCDTPDRIVLNPATEYVAKFTEEIDKARVVHAHGLAKPLNGAEPTGAPVSGDMTVQQMARMLVNETREILPVAGKDGQVIGVLSRQEALDVLLGSEA